MASRSGSEKKNILITGVTSSIGRNLAIQLYNHRRVGMVFGVGKEKKPYYFNDLDPKRFIYRKANILRYRDLKNLFHAKAFQKAKINTVVHLAFHNSQVRGEDVHELNVIGTKNLIENCIADGKITKFVFKSSDVVYKLRPHNPVYLDETADLNFDTDVDQWIKDRVDADMICRSYMDNPTMKMVILRMTSIIGRNVSSPFNAYFDSKPIFKTMGFNPLINLLHMKDVIKAVSLAVFKNVKGIYNIAGQDTAPISTFAELTGATCIGLPEFVLGPVNKVQRMLGLTRYYYSVDRDRQKYTALLDISKAKRELGFEPEGRIEF